MMEQTDKMRMNSGPSPSTTQPLILGNINAMNLLTSNMTGAQNNTVLPNNLMTLPMSGTKNQVIGILPLIIDRSQIPGSSGSSQVIHLNDLNRSNDNGVSVSGSALSQPIYYSNSNSVQLQSKLASADTIILTSSASTLASADTLPLFSSSSDVQRNNNPIIMCEQLQLNQRSSSLQSAFSLVSDLSNRSVDLDSIPTMNLFKPEPGGEIVEVKETMKNLKNGNESVCGLLSKSSSSSLQNNELSSVGYQTRSKSKRKTISESESNQLQIDEDRDTDTETEDAFIYAGRGGEKKENSLTRDDTVIIPSTTQSIALTPTQSHSSLEASDTLILSSNANLETPRPMVASSAGIPLVLCSSSISSNSDNNSHLNTILPVSGGASIIQPPIASIPSIPSLVLTDSMVEGSVNPTLLCHLLSQSSDNPVRIQSLSLDQFASGENLNLLAAALQNSTQQGNSPSVSLHNSTQGPVVVSLQDHSQGPPVVVSLQDSTQGVPSPILTFQNPSQGISPMNTSLQNSTPGVPPPIITLQNSTQGVLRSASSQTSNQGVFSPQPLNRSAKGTQTDWVFGNSPVSLISNRSQVAENNQQAQSAEQYSIPNTFQIVEVERNEQVQLVEDLPFPCADCELKFSSKQELQKHEKATHNKKKIFKCDFCNSTFTRVGNYTRHRKIHNLKPDQKRYTCTECGREFLQRCDLKRHLLIHSNQQPHRCEICDKGYIRHNDLVVHMRFHNKEKNFKCNMCDKRYFQSGDLSRHIRRVHKPASQLTCGHCERKYACEVTLIRHMKLVHKDIIQNTVNQIAETD